MIRHPPTSTLFPTPPSFQPVAPNASLALARGGYRWRDVSPAELAAIARFPGFRRFARQHWRTGLAEMRGSLSKKAYAAAARRYVPELTVEDMVPAAAGIRAQALDRKSTRLNSS